MTAFVDCDLVRVVTVEEYARRTDVTLLSDHGFEHEWRGDPEPLKAPRF